MPVGLVVLNCWASIGPRIEASPSMLLPATGVSVLTTVPAETDPAGGAGGGIKPIPAAPIRGAGSGRGITVGANDLFRENHLRSTLLE